LTVIFDIPLHVHQVRRRSHRGQDRAWLREALKLHPLHFKARKIQGRVRSLIVKTRSPRCLPIALILKVRLIESYIGWDEIRV